MGVSDSRTNSILRRSRPGWTTTQVVGLVAILVVGFFVLRPVFRGAQEINRLTTVGKGLGIRLLTARIRAKDEGRIYACFVKPGTGNYQIGEWTGHLPDGKEQPGVKITTPKNPQHTKQYELPAGVTFVMVDAKLDQRASDMGLRVDLSRRPSHQWSMPILFYPDETNMAARFVLSWNDEYFVNVTLDPKTGESKVSEPYQVSQPSEKEPYDPLKEAGIGEPSNDPLKDLGVDPAK